MSENIHKNHRQRVKEQFLNNGIDVFPQHTIIEMLLYFAIPQKDTNEIAHNLINKYKTINGILEASYDDLLTVNGVTPNAACLITFVLPLMRKYFETDKNNNAVKFITQKIIGEYFVKKFIGHTNELAYVVCLDSTLKMLSCDILAEGTVCETNIDIRKIVEIAVRNNATRVIIAHNHPGGIAIPSNNDVITTRNLKRGLSLLKIELVDHIIVSGQNYSSILERYPEL